MLDLPPLLPAIFGKAGDCQTLHLGSALRTTQEDVIIRSLACQGLHMTVREKATAETKTSAAGFGVCEGIKSLF
jgi:hypothetical protein